MSQHAPARTHGLQHRDAMEWLISGETSAAITSYSIRATAGYDLAVAPSFETEQHEP